MQFPHQFNSNQFNYWKLQQQQKKKNQPYFLYQKTQEKNYMW